jgi:DNA-directed RNA polymerase specialized sigma24 family protein
MLPERGPQASAGDLVALHEREADRLLAYLCSSDRGLGLADAEAVCQQAFQEVRASWPSTGPYSRAEVFLFAAAQRVAAGRPLSSSGGGDPLTDSAPEYWDRADVARLTVLQNSLDRLPLVPRQAVVLREMVGFGPSEVSEIIGLTEAAVESARGDALRTLVPMIDSGTSVGQARRGPLSPEDFAALGRVLQHTDSRLLDDRRRFALALAQPSAKAPAPFVSSQPPVPQTAVFSPQLTQAAPAFGQGAPAAPQPMAQPMQPMAQPMQPMAQPASPLGGAVPSGEALFASSGPVPAGGADPSAAGGWMGGFGARRTPPSVSASPLTGGIPLAAGGFPGQQAPVPPMAQPGVPMFQTAPRPGFAPPAAGGQMFPMATGPAPVNGAPMAPNGASYNGRTYDGGTYNGRTYDGGTYNGRTYDGGTYNGSGSGGTYNGRTYDGGTYNGSGSGGISDGGRYNGSEPGMPPAGMRPGTTPLDATGMSFGDIDPSIGTPIFDSVSAWFLSPSADDPSGRSRSTASRWASLQDASWREASARAAASPRVSGSTGAGLPVRSPGVNMVPSMAEAVAGMARPSSREAPRPDAGRVRSRLDSFQQGLQTARQVRDQLSEPPDSARGADAAPASAPLSRDEASGLPGVLDAAPPAGAKRPREGGFGAFYRDYLPSLLALLMVEGARPAAAAQVAQDAMSEAYREWATLDDPQEWTRQVALSGWSAQRGSADDGSAAT